MQRTNPWPLLALPLAAPLQVFAAGFANYTLGADEVGAPSFARAASPAAGFWNPALLTGLSGTQVQFGAGLFFPSREWTSDTGGATAETRKSTSVSPHLYLSHAVSERVSAGFYVNSPFGLESEWEDGWEGRYINLKSGLTTLETGLNLAYRPAAGFSVGGGVRYLSVDSVSKQNINLSGFGLPDGLQRFSGDDARVLWQLGAAAELSPGLSVGLNYRSGSAMALDGEVEFSNIPAPLRPAMPDTGATARIAIPAQAFAGIAFERDALVLEAGLRWEQWSDYQSQVIELERPVNGVTRIVQDKRWEDTLALLLGLRYQASPQVGLRFGYIYEPSAVPDDTLDYSVTDTDKQFLTAGVEWRASVQTRLSLGYTHGIYDDRRKANDVGANQGAPANGLIEQGLDMLTLSLTHGF